jgi:hypothetical protein
MNEQLENRFDSSGKHQKESDALPIFVGAIDDDMLLNVVRTLAVNESPFHVYSASDNSSNAASMPSHRALIA